MLKIWVMNTTGEHHQLLFETETRISCCCFDLLKLQRKLYKSYEVTKVVKLI